MWVVRVALQRPHTFIVLAVLLMILGPLTILRTATDIFPSIDIPVISIVWGYAGLPPDEMSGRVVNIFERTLPTTVNNIEHIESQSLNGIAVVKLFFQPHVNIEMATSQVTSISQTILRQLPPGVTPPLILTYNAASVPVIQLALSSNHLSEQELFDQANSFIRNQLASVEGASMPYPYGGKQRQVQVDIDQSALLAHGLSAQDVTAAINAQNLILPAGTEKIGDYEYNIKLNGSPKAVELINDLPIKFVNGAMVYIRDVAHVRDGFPPQTNIVRVDGKRAALLGIQKTGSASTLDIINKVKERLPMIQASAPPDFNMRLMGDQSVFVKSAIQGVVREAIIAAALTGAMILLFLGSWRSTLIITISIPLSILASIICLSALGQTINIMTLGGLALAVGILVDDATVTIENINSHLEEGKDVETAILDGASQIALPALVSTLCVCIVFVPMFLLSGVARFLFIPLAEAVVFAMLASYILSRTLVPTLAKYWLRVHQPHRAGAPERGRLARFQAGFERRFEALRTRYRGLLVAAIDHRIGVSLGFAGAVLISFLLVPWLGEDFFPAVDAGQIKLHFRTHSGTRVEETAKLCDMVEVAIREIIPAGDIASVADSIGPPVSGINLSYSNSGTIGPADADIMIQLKPDHRPVTDDVEALRNRLPQQFPGVSFASLPADMVGQILNFGLPSPIDVQIVGRDAVANSRFANLLYDRLKHVSGVADLRIQQPNDYPEFRLAVDRSRAEELGLAQRDVANNMLISLSGSFQTAPTFWLAPNGVSYPIATQTPQFQLTSLDDLRNVPITGSSNGPPQILGGLATIERGAGPATVSRYDAQPVVDIFAAVRDRRDLGSAATAIQKVIDDSKAELPAGDTIVMRGQVQTMTESFTGLYAGMIFAIVLVYLLIVVNFQSWVDPLIIISALPAALAGIIWMLFVTRTTISVPALTGAIMTVGVATANSILVISFARDRVRSYGDGVLAAAIEAGTSRIRPVLMTALAMIIGMVPMALGLGEGGEQNAPLGRAVIGGLMFATVATLFLVPAVFCLVHARRDGSKSP